MLFYVIIVVVVVVVIFCLILPQTLFKVIVSVQYEKLAIHMIVKWEFCYIMLSLAPRLMQFCKSFQMFL